MTCLCGECKNRDCEDEDAELLIDALNNKQDDR